MVSETSGENERAVISLDTLHGPDSEHKKAESPSRGKLESLKGGKDHLDPLAVQRSLKTGFLITLGVGATCIFAFRNAGLWNIILSVIVMGCYWWFASSRAQTITAKSVFADSFYYLGCLFTFIALIATMIGLNSNDFRPEAIVGQIGPALATTVIGMAVRIYITQFDAITSEPEVEVLSGLGELSSNLSSAISELQSMISEHIKTSNSQQKSNLALSEKYSQQIARLDFTSAVSSLKSFSSEIATLTTQVNLLSKVTGQTEAGAAKLTSSIFRATTELNKTSQEFSRYQDIGNDFDDAKESLLQVSEDARALKDVIDESAKLDIIKTITELDAKVNFADQKLVETHSQIERLSTSTSDAQIRLDDSLSKLDGSTEVVRDITEQLTALEGLSADLLDTKTTVQSLRNDVEKINTQISSEIAGAREELAKTTDMASDILKLEIAPITNAINQVAQDFAPIQKSLNDLDVRVRKSVSEVLDFLNN